ncbi:zf-HC2 domain-containing protein [Brevibacillus massiliensis]|jgi:ElaB/YqjD/DUF883 family membrane-anchored ribosome-binding protein|uniref:zf-HC2 domain-containing protein n=1 Tax=Brevibacillus massiliensis TaxID=1118054 RepID=UPI0002F9346E|nr:zf-HC2 domain-containing protein [Brevibacillus massiliensis]
MKCQEAREKLTEYTDHLLPEVTRRRIDQHLAECDSCRSEFRVWAESGRWIQADKQQYANVKPSRSIVDAVMARIMSEEKWAIPIGRKVFTLTARMRRIGASVAILLLTLSVFSLYNNTSDKPIAAGSLVPSKPEVIAAANETTQGLVKFSSGAETTSKQEVAATDKFVYNADFETGVGPNYGLILGIFGILITVIGLSWMTRA